MITVGDCQLAEGQIERVEWGDARRRLIEQLQNMASRSQVAEKTNSVRREPTRKNGDPQESLGQTQLASASNEIILNDGAQK